jgi:predicted phosphodiesterase
VRILVISDIHSNLAALEAVLAACGEMDGVWNVGDTIGYGPKPRECLDRMVDLYANPVLVGNHDLPASARSTSASSIRSHKSLLAGHRSN